MPETRYAKTEDGLRIAYQVVGVGPPDIIMPPLFGALDTMWDEPAFEHFLKRLTAIGRIICFEFRGFGGSDPVPLGALPAPEEWMEDMRVVMNAVGSEAATIVCEGAPGIMAMLFAATYPERTNALVLIDSFARTLRADDYPFGTTPDVLDTIIRAMEEVWGTGVFASSPCGPR